jgi:hypothetical protein
MSEQVDATAARRILAVIVRPAAGPVNQTVEAISGKVTMPATQVFGVLRDLAEVKPPVVHGERDAGLDIEFWSAIEPGASAWLDHAENGPG